MLILSKAAARFGRDGRVVKAEGWLAPHAARLARIAQELGLSDMVIKHRFGRWVLPRRLDARVRTRLLNTLAAEFGHRD
jgi:hypothetical protein